MADDDVLVLNDYRSLRLDQRTRKGGKQYVTISIAADPIAVNLNEREIARPVAEAIAEAIRKQTREIAETVSKATAAKRKAAEVAFAKGEAWAMKRYAGGRMGAMPPNQSGDKLFNDSGRLAAGITVNPDAKEGRWVINAPANRWVASNFKPGQMEALAQRWASLVPALRDPLDVPSVRDVLQKTTQAMIAVLHDKSAEAADRARRLVLQNTARVLQLVARVVA